MLLYYGLRDDQYVVEEEQEAVLNSVGVGNLEDRRGHDQLPWGIIRVHCCLRATSQHLIQTFEDVSALRRTRSVNVC